MRGAGNGRPGAESRRWCAGCCLAPLKRWRRMRWDLAVTDGIALRRCHVRGNRTEPGGPAGTGPGPVRVARPAAPRRRSAPAGTAPPGGKGTARWGNPGVPTVSPPHTQQGSAHSQNRTEKATLIGGGGAGLSPAWQRPDPAAVCAPAGLPSPSGTRDPAAAPPRAGGGAGEAEPGTVAAARGAGRPRRGRVTSSCPASAAAATG